MNVSLIYMASGFGKRYGTNKLLTEFQGEPLYLHGLPPFRSIPTMAPAIFKTGAELYATTSLFREMVYSIFS